MPELLERKGNVLKIKGIDTVDKTPMIEKAGTYIVTLTVTDDEGETDTKSGSITVGTTITPSIWGQPWMYVLIGGAVIVILAAAALRRKGRMPKEAQI